MEPDLSFELAGGPYAVTAARLALADLDSALDPSTAFDVRLLVSELLCVSIGIPVMIAKNDLSYDFESMLPQFSEESFWARDSTECNDRSIYHGNIQQTLGTPDLKVSLRQFLRGKGQIDHHGVRTR